MMPKKSLNALLFATLAGCVLPADEPPASNPTTKTAVYEFGDYHVIQSDSLPRLQGDSLHVELGFQCAGAPLTLEHFKTTDSTYEVWLNMPDTLPRPACAIPIVETHTYKVPDEFKNAASVKLVTPDLERIELIPPPAPVYDFGEGYRLIVSDSMPRVQGDSLYVDAGHMCSPAWLVLEHFQTGDSTYEVWLNMPNQPRPQCAIPVVARHAFKLPDEIKNAASVKLVTPDLKRIELIPPPAPVYDFGDEYGLLQNDSLPRLQGDSLYVQLAYDCGGVPFTLEHFKTADSSYEVWLKMPYGILCAMPVVERRAFKVPDEIRDAQSVQLVIRGVARIGTSGFEWVELKN